MISNFNKKIQNLLQQNDDYNELDDNGKLLFEKILEDKNILIHGPGGTGKTYLIKIIRTILNRIYYTLNYDKFVYCVGPTGVSAVEIKGTTIHSCLGLGAPHTDHIYELDMNYELETDIDKKRDMENLRMQYINKLVSELYYKIKSNKKVIYRWKKIKILIIDEISMVGKIFIEIIDRLAKLILDNNCPMGGIQVIFCGDFYQLPPVKDDWIFKTTTWNNLNLYIHNLSVPKRYKDIDFYNMLLRIRKHKETEEDMKKLLNRYNEYKLLKEKIYNSSKDNLNNDDILPTMLYAKNINANDKNEKELAKLKGKKYIFKATDTVHKIINRQNLPPEKERNKLLSYQIPEILSYKIGAQVMLRYNLDIDNELINGSRGIITDIVVRKIPVVNSNVQTEFIDEYVPTIGADKINDDTQYIIEKYITVKFKNGISYNVEPINYTIETPDYEISRKQFPLILAWSYTIHKSQGCTLDSVIIDLGDIFADGQAYVSLSRVRSLDGLYIKNMSQSCIHCDQEVLSYFG